MITVQGVTKCYGDLKAVDDLNFAIEKGEIVGLLGQNGAGKTTCMKIITGYLEPSSGTVTVDGHDVIEQRIRVQAQVGYLPENAPLYPEMLVEEYLRYIAELRGLRGKKREIALEEALDSTGLSARRKQEINTLSKGYKQRVGLAQAIIHKPSILILDEPTNGLDPVQIQEIRTLIKRLAQDTTILLSTHILSEIEAVCDRVVILIDGQIASDSTLQELLSRHSLRLKLKDAQKVQDELTKHFQEIHSIQSTGKDALGYEIYQLKLKEDIDPSSIIPQLAENVLKAGWTLGGLDIETQSLELAFRELMVDHVERVLNT